MCSAASLTWAPELLDAPILHKPAKTLVQSVRDVTLVADHSRVRL